MAASTAETLYGVDAEDNWYLRGLGCSGRGFRKHLHSSEPSLPLGWGTLWSIWQDLSHIIRQLIISSFQVLIHRLITDKKNGFLWLTSWPWEREKSGDFSFWLQLITSLQMIDGFTRWVNFTVVFPPYHVSKYKELSARLRGKGVCLLFLWVSIIGAHVWIQESKMDKYVFT